MGSLLLNLKIIQLKFEVIGQHHDIYISLIHIYLKSNMQKLYFIILIKHSNFCFVPFNTYASNFKKNTSVLWVPLEQLAEWWAPSEGCQRRGVEIWADHVPKPFPR